MENEDDKMKYSYCSACGGSGYIVVPGCCNQPLENGECCGNAVAVQEQCSDCGGAGSIWLLSDT